MSEMCRLGRVESFLFRLSRGSGEGEVGSQADDELGDRRDPEGEGAIN